MNMSKEKKARMKKKTIKVTTKKRTESWRPRKRTHKKVTQTFKDS